MYGPVVILDYIRHYSEDRIGGLQFVGAVTKLGSEKATSVLTPEFLSLLPQFFSSDTETSVCALKGLLRLCFADEPSATDLYLTPHYLGHLSSVAGRQEYTERRDYAPCSGHLSSVGYFSL